MPLGVLSILVAVVSLGVVSALPASALAGPAFDISVLDGQNPRTQGDRGRWVRWPDQEGKPFLRLGFFETGEDGHVSLWLGLGNEERNTIGPGNRSARLEGTFDPNGFDLTLPCEAGTGCLATEYWHPRRRKALRAAGVSVTYRYHVRVFSEKLIHVTAYTPRISFSGDQLAGVENEGLAREFYLTRDDDCARSLETVRNELVDGEFADRFLLALGAPEPLMRGARIAENTPQPREVFTTDRASCFFYLDLVPTAAHAHPVLYVLTDRETAKITHKAWAMAPPIVSDPGRDDGKPAPWYETLETRVGSPDQFFPMREADLERPVLDGPIHAELPGMEGPVSASGLMSEPPGASGSPVPGQTILDGLSWLVPGQAPVVLPFPAFAPIAVAAADDCPATRKVALLVNAGKDLAFTTSISRMRIALESMGFTVHERRWDRHSLQEVRDAIATLSAPLSSCDAFLLYVVGHTVAHQNCTTCLMGGYRTDGEIFYNHEFGTLSAHPWSLTNLASNQSRSVNTDTGPGLLHSIRGIKAGHIFLVLDKCNSGLLIDAVSAPWGGPPIAGNLSRRQTLTIFTATRRNQMSDIARDANYSFWGWLARGDAFSAGAVFTSIFSRYLADKSEDADANGNGVVDRGEFARAAREAMDETIPDFSGPIDGWLRGRTQTPQVHALRGKRP